MDNLINTLLTGGVVIALYKITISFFNKNVTEERIKWRETIREITNKIYSFKPNKMEEGLEQPEVLFSKLVTRLNTFDSDNDLKIIQIAKEILFSEAGKEIKELQFEFLVRVSLLLKSDWEKSKFESSLRYHLFGCVYSSPKSIILDENKLMDFLSKPRSSSHCDVFKNDDLKCNFALYKKEYKYPR